MNVHVLLYYPIPGDLGRFYRRSVDLDTETGLYTLRDRGQCHVVAEAEISQHPEFAWLCERARDHAARRVRGEQLELPRHSRRSAEVKAQEQAV